MVFFARALIAGGSSFTDKCFSTINNSFNNNFLQIIVDADSISVHVESDGPSHAEKGRYEIKLAVEP
jgi:hypothetical protein